MIIMIKNYLWAYVELKKKSFLHDKGVKKTSELENALLAIHKICMQISLSWKLTLSCYEEREKKKRSGIIWEWQFWT